MKATVQFIISAFVVGLLSSSAYAANEEWSKAYTSCAKEAEKNEVEFADLRTFIKGCMVESGISSADADSTLDELAGPQAAKTDKEEG